MKLSNILVRSGLVTHVFSDHLMLAYILGYQYLVLEKIRENGVSFTQSVLPLQTANTPAFALEQ